VKTRAARRATAAVASCAVIGVLAGCLLAGPKTAAADTTIVGAGSTFDLPFFSRAFYQYKSDHADISVNYQSIGSGGGIQQFTARTVDFGASDVPLNSKELKAASEEGEGHHEEGGAGEKDKDTTQTPAASPSTTPGHK